MKNPIANPSGLFKPGKRTAVSIQIAHAFATAKKGKCLSSTCSSAKQYLIWQCEFKHSPWRATYDSVKCGSWCPECSGVKKLTIEVAVKEAKKHGGKCISKKYINGKSLLTWQCRNLHQPWRACLNSIRSGTWCPYCNASGTGQSIRDMKVLAQTRSGRCLSEQYKSARLKLKWQCFYRHAPWLATPDDIKNGRWCPSCSHGLGERIVREYFESIFSKSFPNCRPDFLLNPATGVNLELDGYCKSLKLAFEHHGRQHFSTSSRFSIDAKALKLRKKTDKLKRKLCAQAGVKLIEIKSVPDMISLRHLPKYLEHLLQKHSVFVPRSKDLSQIKIKNAYLPESKEQIKKAQTWARDKNGKCLSQGYLGFHGKLVWQCEFKHEPWDASPAKIYSGRWCPTCGGRKKKTLEQAQDLATKFGGHCNAKRLINGKTKIPWSCKNGHSWKASFDSVNRGSRCPHCFNVWRASGFKGVRP